MGLGIGNLVVPNKVVLSNGAGDFRGNKIHYSVV